MSRGIRQEANICACTSFLQHIEILKVIFVGWDIGFRVIFCLADVHHSTEKNLIIQYLSSKTGSKRFGECLC